jgi:hypothetical protein
MDISLMDGSWLPFAATAAADARRRVLALGIRWMLTASQSAFRASGHNQTLWILLTVTLRYCLHDQVSGTHEAPIASFRLREARREEANALRRPAAGRCLISEARLVAVRLKNGVWTFDAAAYAAARSETKTFVRLRALSEGKLEQIQTREQLQAERLFRVGSPQVG